VVHFRRPFFFYGLKRRFGYQREAQ
jgi:hypothetical protein